MGTQLRQEDLFTGQTFPSYHTGIGPVSEVSGVADSVPDHTLLEQANVDGTRQPLPGANDDEQFLALTGNRAAVVQRMVRAV